MRKQSKKIYIIITVIIVTLMCIVRIVFVNNKYPKPEIVNVKSGDTDIVENNIEMRVLSARIIPENELKSKYYYEEDLKSTKAVSIKACFTNTGDVDVTFYPYNVHIESDSHFHNALNMQLAELEEKPPLNMELTSGETKTCFLDYTMYKNVNFTDEAWKNIGKEKGPTFFLVDGLYPVKRCFMIR